jgi:hypothetical protein
MIFLEFLFLLAQQASCTNKYCTQLFFDVLFCVFNTAGRLAPTRHSQLGTEIRRCIHYRIITVLVTAISERVSVSNHGAIMAIEKCRSIRAAAAAGKRDFVSALVHL